MKILVEGYGYAPELAGDIASDLEQSCRHLNNGELPLVGDDFETRFAPIQKDSAGRIILHFVGDFFSQRLGERVLFLPKTVSRNISTPSPDNEEDAPLYVLGRHLPNAIVNHRPGYGPLSIEEQAFLMRLIDRVRLAIDTYLRTNSPDTVLAVRSGGNGQCLCVPYFHALFEAIMEQLLCGDKAKAAQAPPDPNDLLSPTLPDGHIIDHLFIGPSLTSPTRQTYYIGDSKYYTEGFEPAPPIVAKQYTYARDVIQRNVAHCINDPQPPSISLRDNATGSYDIIPNFFISPRLEVPCSFDDDQLTLHNPFHHWQRQVPGRLLDRDTLHIFHFDIDLPFALSIYARQDPGEMADWRAKARARIHTEIQLFLKHHYLWRVLTPPPHTRLKLSNPLASLRLHPQSLADLTHSFLPEGCAITLDNQAGTLLLALDTSDPALHEYNARLLTALLRKGIKVENIP